MKEITEREYTIGVYLIGCLEEDGYLRREIDLIVDDLAFNYNLSTDITEVNKVLKLIQSFDPAGGWRRNFARMFITSVRTKT